MANFDNILGRINQGVPELDNTSVSSIWRRMAAVFSSVIDIVNLEMRRSQDIVEYAARNLRVMGKKFYIDTALAYQDGDPVVVVDPDTLREGYSTIDPSKQIIKQVAVVTPETGQIVMKVATTDSDGKLIPLNTTQLQSFQSYIRHFTPLGIEITVVSSEADTIDAARLYIRYNAEYSLTAIQTSLHDMLISFQTSFNPDVPLFVNDIEAAIRQIPGIRDAWFEGIQAIYNSAGSVIRVDPENGVLTLNAGYFNFDEDIYDWTSGITIFEQV